MLELSGFHKYFGNWLGIDANRCELAHRAKAGRLGFAGCRFVARLVVAPLLHDIVHGKDLPFKSRATGAHRQVQAHAQALRQRQCPVLAGDQQGGNFLAGVSKGHHVALALANQFSSRHSRRRRRARCN